MWALAIELEPKNTRKAKIVDALKHNDNDPYVIVAVAKLFWKDKKYEKAKKWFERAIALDPLVGDSWAYYYKFIKDCIHSYFHHSYYYYYYPEEGSEMANIVFKKCVEQNPKKGEIWNKVRQSATHGKKFTPQEIIIKSEAII